MFSEKNAKTLFSGWIFLLAGLTFLLPFLLYIVSGGSSGELLNNKLFDLTILFYLLTFCLVILLKQGLALNLLFLFIFAGILFSVDIGFTLKASQVFAVFALCRILIGHFNPEQNFNSPNKLKLKTFYPFIIFSLAILPSLIMPALFSDLYESTSALRALLNYLFLQIICLAVFTGINDKKRLKQGLLCCFIAYLWVLAFGFFQQTGYYAGFYDPFQYVGSHSVFVDLYGPFLRIAPGTFANEFGEILQSVAITLTTFLVFMKDQLSFKSKLVLKISLFITVIALILNFTRASWIVYLFFLVCLFFIARPRLKTKLLIFSIIALIGACLYFIDLKTDLFSLIPILERFNELTDLSGNSAGIRLITWTESFALFKQSPLIGNGWGTTIETHNVPLELLSETGIIGFLGFYFLMFVLLKRFFKMVRLTADPFLKTVAISTCFTLSGCLLFDLTNHGIYHFILWLIIGFGLAAEEIIKNKRTCYN